MYIIVIYIKYAINRSEKAWNWPLAVGSTDESRIIAINQIFAYKVIHSNYLAGIVMGVTSVRLRPEIEDPLEKLANKLDRSKNYLINQAIKEFLERKTVDEKRWSETLEAIESVKSNRLVEEKDVNAWLESWGKDNELKPPKI